MAKYTKYMVLCGLMFINLSLNLTYYVGNLSTYMYSVQYSQGRQNTMDIDASWILPVYMVCKVIGAFATDFLARKIGLGLTTVVGIALSLAVPLTYFAVSHSIWTSTVTLALVGGTGNHILYTGNLMHVSRWFKDGVGLATAMPYCTGALGGVVVNQIITAYINPWNLSPDSKQGEILYFSQPEIIERIPVVFLLIGGYSFTVQLIGFCLVRSPPQDDEPDEKSGLLESPRKCGNEGSRQRNNSMLDASEKSDHSHGERVHLTLPSTSVKLHARDGDAENRPKTQLRVSNHQEIKDHEPVSLTPLQLLKSENYYLLECVVGVQAIAYLIVLNYYKLFGQLWIEDDKFLAVVGSTLAFCVIPCYLLCGTLVDRFGIKTTLVAHLAISSICLSLWYFTASPSRWLYLAWTIILYCLQYNIRFILPCATLKLFGKEFYASNFGLVQIVAIIVFLGMAPVITFTISTLGWFWLFFISALLLLCSMLPLLLRLTVAS